MKTLLSRFLQDEEAGAAIEYSLVASIVSLAVVAAAITIGTSLNSILQGISGNF
jgi:pilus assembly protein Flp/PilA